MPGRIRTRVWLPAASIVVLFGFSLGSWLVRPGPSVHSAPLALVPGRGAEHELAATELHRYEMGLAAGEFVQLVVEQIGIDVEVSLFDLQGHEILRVNSWNGDAGPEPVEIVAESPGTYRLEISPTYDGTAGRYRVDVAARRAATAADYERDQAARLFSLAERLSAQDDPRSQLQALESYRTASDRWQAAGEPLRQAIALCKIGYLKQRRGDLPEAIDAYRQSLARFRESDENHRLVPWVLDRLGTSYKGHGDRRRALESYEEALRLARKIEDPHREALVLGNIAVFYRSLGKSQRAIAYYEQAVALGRQLADPSAMVLTLANVSRFYIDMNQWERAQTLALEALRLSERSGGLAEARALSTLGTIEQRLGHPEESLSSLERALAIYREIDAGSDQALALRELARTHLEMDDREAALAACERALGLARKIPSSLIEALVISDRGWIYGNGFADPVRALADFEDAVDRFQRLEYPFGRASALYGAARAERELGHLARARSRIDEAIEIVEAQRAQSDVIALRSSYLAAKQDYYELKTDLLNELHRRDPGAGFDALALETSERRRARALLDALTQALDVDPVEDGSGLSTRSTSLRIRSGSGSSAIVPALGVADIQRMLDDETVLLEYSLGETRSFLWLVTPSEVRLYELPARKKLEDLARRTYLVMLESRGRKVRSQRLLIARDMSRALLGPVADQLGSQRLLVVADGALRYVPFGALPIPGRGPTESEEPMVTEHEIVYSPSLSVLAVLRAQLETRTPAKKLVAVVADPVFDEEDPRIPKLAPEVPSDLHRLGRLLASRDEALSIRALAPAGEETLAALGFEASRDLVQSGLLADYRFVHFATHVVFDPQKPDASGLVLSRFDEHGQPRDGYLRPHEVYGLELPVEMVALSACRSGLGREVRGEGLVGLAQGFMCAGAARVLVSFWQVDDDATAELMKRLYRGIFEDGLRPAAALQSAQVAMLRETRWQAPYFWAGFFLEGEWR